MRDFLSKSATIGKLTNRLPSSQTNARKRFHRSIGITTTQLLDLRLHFGSARRTDRANISGRLHGTATNQSTASTSRESHALILDSPNQTSWRACSHELCQSSESRENQSWSGEHDEVLWYRGVRRQKAMNAEEFEQMGIWKE